MKLFVASRFYYAGITLLLAFVASYFFPVLYPLAKAFFFIFLGLSGTDLLMLFGTGGRVSGKREVPERFSNGDENVVSIWLASSYRFAVKARVLDELPPQFQLRNMVLHESLSGGTSRLLTYALRPVERGEYQFGKINIYVSSALGLFERRFAEKQFQTVKVYPSFLQLRKYELMAFSQQQSIEGQRKLRKIGHSLEFDHIKDYTVGDDPRHINWQATARRGNLMVNHFVDEKSQAIYNVIDKSRPMKMPFGGMTLLDYAINASLALSSIALKKGDRAGLITFQHKPEALVPAQKGPRQMHIIMESLYGETTDFNEHNFGLLYAQVAARLSTRSLLLLYTNFESQYSLERQLKYLKLLNRKHLVLLIIFRNTELDKLLASHPESLREVYQQAIAQNMLNEKYAIMYYLHQHGILSMYTSPQSLTADVINKYLELKSRRMI